MLPSFSSRVIHTCSCTPKSPSQIAFWSKTHSNLVVCVSSYPPYVIFKPLSHLSELGKFKLANKILFFPPLCFTLSPLLLFQREFPKADGPPPRAFMFRALGSSGRLKGCSMITIHFWVPGLRTLDSNKQEES